MGLLLDLFWGPFWGPKRCPSGGHIFKVFRSGSRAPCGPILASFWLLPGLSWAHLGPILAPLGFILAPFWPHLGPLGLSCRRLGALLGPVLALLAALGPILALLASYFLQRPTSLCSFYAPALGFISCNQVVVVVVVVEVVLVVVVEGVVVVVLVLIVVVVVVLILVEGWGILLVDGAPYMHDRTQNGPKLQGLIGTQKFGAILGSSSP